MTLSAFAAQAAEHHIVTELPMPTFMYGVIALVIFLVLGVATWSYRDVANRHSHKWREPEHSADGGHGH